MGKCVICGKHGIFLRVDKEGRCKECVQRIEKEMASDFEEFYGNLSNRLKDLNKEIKITPYNIQECISQAEYKINEYRKIKVEIHKTPNIEKQLYKVLKKSITYKDDFCKMYNIGRLSDWELGIDTKDFLAKHDLSEVDESIESKIKHQNILIKNLIRANEYQNTLEEIPSISATVSDTKHSKKRLSDLDELKYSGITAKTNYDRIGNFVVIDTETTGLNAQKDNIIEFSAIRFEDWTPIEKFSTLLNPGKPIPPEATNVNGITNDMVKEAPTFAEIIDSLDEFIGKSNLVGHNLPFDLKFLYKNGYDFTAQKRKYYDTLEIAKKILKKPKMKWDKELEEYVEDDNCDYDVENHKLTTLCDYYEIRNNVFAHRALSDAYATGILLQKLAQDKIGD